MIWAHLWMLLHFPVFTLPVGSVGSAKNVQTCLDCSMDEFEHNRDPYLRPGLSEPSVGIHHDHTATKLKLGSWWAWLISLVRHATSVEPVHTALIAIKPYDAITQQKLNANLPTWLPWLYFHICSSFTLSFEGIKTLCIYYDQGKHSKKKISSTGWWEKQHEWWNHKSLLLHTCNTFLFLSSDWMNYSTYVLEKEPDHKLCVQTVIWIQTQK